MSYRRDDRGYSSSSSSRDYGDRKRDDRDRGRDHRDYGSGTRDRDRDGQGDRDRDRNRDWSRERDRDSHSRSADSRSVDSRSVDSRSVDSRSVDSRSVDSRMSSFSRDSDRGGSYTGNRNGDRGGAPQSGRGGGNGRGFGGGGGRGRGDMSRNVEVTRLLRGTGMSDEDILNQVLQLPEEDINSRVAKPAADGTLIPPVEDWRYSRDVGARLSHATEVVIRSNHFRVDVANMPAAIYQYHVHYCKYNREGILEEELTSSHEKDTKNRKQKDYRLYTTLMQQWKNMHHDWFYDKDGHPLIGFCFDGLNTVFTTQKLPCEGEFLREDVAMPTVNEKQLSNVKYQLTINTAVDGIVLPRGTEAWKNVDISVLRALDCSLFDFARWQQIDSDPKWVTVGSKVFPTSLDQLPIKDGIHARQGFYMALKTCKSGLVLVSDLVVTAFLNSGAMLNTMAALGGYRNMNDFLDDCKRGLPSRAESVITSSIKGMKVKTHLGYTIKVRGLGPSADSEKSMFEFEERNITVAQYMKERYDIVLKYPHAPTINIGSSKRQVLMPAELCSVPVGQVRSKQEPDMVAQLIKYAAVKPDERYRFIAGGLLLPELMSSATTSAFGVSRIATAALAPEAVLLPPPKLQYADKIVEPGLQGSWHSSRFLRRPPGDVNGSYPFGVLVVDPRRGQWEDAVENVLRGLSREAGITGVNITPMGRPVECDARADDLKRQMEGMISRGAKFILVVLCSDSYPYVKLEADRLGIISQCLRLDKVKFKIPGGYLSNVMLKINVKLGGTNHMIGSRYSAEDLGHYRQFVASGEILPVFQEPPASLSWILDKHCMIVGIDVSHPEPSAKGSSREEAPSIAAVVGTVDGSASQYVCHVQAQESRLEVVDSLTGAMYNLLGAFRERNGGQMPKHLLVYRDGVGDSQFEMILENELTSIQDAIALQKNHDGVKIAFVICQKSHHARFVCETQGGTGGYTNLCPGVVIDSSSSGDSGVTSTKLNEFYLNSHTAIQGTGKATKYSLIYDDINMKMIELEILSYWLTYMYCRCNKSVSICTPIYYAHWAACRARHLLSAGADPAEINKISKEWSQKEHSTMFFV